MIVDYSEFKDNSLVKHVFSLTASFQIHTGAQSVVSWVEKNGTVYDIMLGIALPNTSVLVCMWLKYLK